MEATQPESTLVEDDGEDGDATLPEDKAPPDTQLTEFVPLTASATSVLPGLFTQQASAAATVAGLAEGLTDAWGAVVAAAKQAEAAVVDRESSYRKQAADLIVRERALAVAQEEASARLVQARDVEAAAKEAVREAEAKASVAEVAVAEQAAIAGRAEEGQAALTATVEQLKGEVEAAVAAARSAEDRAAALENTVAARDAELAAERGVLADTKAQAAKDREEAALAAHNLKETHRRELEEAKSAATTAHLALEDAQRGHGTSLAAALDAQRSVSSKLTARVAELEAGMDSHAAQLGASTELVVTLKKSLAEQTALVTSLRAELEAAKGASIDDDLSPPVVGAAPMPTPQHAAAHDEPQLVRATDGHTVALPAGVHTVLGRGEVSKMFDTRVSRKHASLLYDAVTNRVQLNKTARNPVFVQRKGEAALVPVDDAMLEHGDLVQCLQGQDSTRFMVVLPQRAGAEADAVPPRPMVRRRGGVKRRSPGATSSGGDGESGSRLKSQKGDDFLNDLFKG